MAGHTGYYSLIQYCPNASRAECANVGVLLFCPDLNFLDAHLTSGNDRVRRFFGKDLQLDLARLNTQKKAIKDRLLIEKDHFRSLGDLENYIRTRANRIRITEPRSIRVVEPAKQLTELFEELVDGRRGHYAVQPVREFQELHQIFEQPRLQGKIERNLKLTLPDLHRDIEFPYAYVNGTQNLVKPQKLQAGSHGIDKAMVLAYEGELIQFHNHDKKVIVVLFGDESEKWAQTEQDARRVLELKKVRAVSRRELPQFEDEVLTLAH